MLESELRGKVVSTMQCWVGWSEGNGRFKEIIDTYNSMETLPRAYPVKYTDEWCAATVTAAGIVNGCTRIIHPECGVEEMARLYEAEGRLYGRDYKPTPGDIVFYSWACNGWGDHVGIVESVGGDMMTVLEGNKGKAVGQRYISTSWQYIRGYGVPDYKHEAARQSIKALADISVINSPDYWIKAVEGDTVPGLCELFGAAADNIKKAGPRLLDTWEAAEKLGAAGILPGDLGGWLEQSRIVGTLLQALGGCV